MGLGVQLKQGVTFIFKLSADVCDWPPHFYGKSGEIPSCS